MFHRQFPEKRISIYRLRKAYREAGIKLKKIQTTKIVTKGQKASIELQLIKCKAEVEHHLEEGFRIVYVDEICTTKSTIPTHEWSAKNRPVRLDYRQFARECIATIAAVSLENGVDLVMNMGQSVNTKKFCQFLVALRRKYKGDKMAIFMDQLAVHRSLVVQRKMEELGMRCIFNAAYSPDYNPIEGVFSVAKRKIKQERLKDVMSK